MIDPGCSDSGTVEVFMGQTSMRAKRELVGLDSVLKAALAYLKDGVRAGELTWSRQQLVRSAEGTSSTVA